MEGNIVLTLLPKKVFAGENSTKNIQSIIEQNTVRKILIFTDEGIAGAGLLDYLETFIPDTVEKKTITSVSMEPSYQEVQKSIDELGEFSPNLVIGLGGGSVIDTAKLFSVVYQTEYTVKDLLEDSSRAQKKILSLMIPTTCGTGAEATINAIVAVPEKEVKIGIVSEEMLPDYVILDPYNIKNLPKSILASSASDAFCHGIECYTSLKANLISNVYAQACCKLIIDNLEKAYEDKEDLDARLSLLIGSFFGGTAITASGTTAVHALSYPLGGKFHIPHGVSNAILLPHVMRENMSDCLPHLAELSERILPVKEGLSEEEKAERLMTRIEGMIKAVDIPTDLTKWNVTEDDLDFLVESAYQQRRLLDNNRKNLTLNEIRSIYKKVL